MRMPRFRIRTMMVVVAVVALLIAGTFEVLRLRGRSGWYGFRSRDAGNRARMLRARLTTLAQILNNEEAPTDENFPAERKKLRELHAREIRVELARRTRIIEYFERLEAKYERAARYPWQPVEPDPPEPEQDGKPPMGGK